VIEIKLTEIEKKYCCTLARLLTELMKTRPRVATIRVSSFVYLLSTNVLSVDPSCVLARGTENYNMNE